MIQPDVPPRLVEIQTKTPDPDCKGDRRDCVQELSDWADQYRGELEKQSSARAAQVESLLIAGDYEAIREWLCEWEEEDKVSGSLRQRYAPFAVRTETRTLSPTPTPALWLGTRQNYG